MRKFAINSTVIAITALFIVFDTHAASKDKPINVLLKNPTLKWDHSAVLSGPMGNSLRTERYRFIQYVDVTEELYDHNKDHNEWVNLANNPEYEKIKQRLAKLMPKRIKSVDSKGDVAGKSVYLGGTKIKKALKQRLEKDAKRLAAEGH